MVARGSDRERELAAEGRRQALGAWYTPAEVVDGLLDLALDPVLAEAAARGADAVAALRVLDPACGDGNFLAAAAARIERTLTVLGLPPEEAARSARACVAGTDVDAGAVAACRSRLGVGEEQVVHGDALLLPADRWRGIAPAGFDVVVGNPPFLGQLRRATARAGDDAAGLRARFGPLVGPYTDPAALFLALAVEQARDPGGVVALVLPTPLAAVRDAAPARTAVLARAEITDVWVAGEPVFEAAVSVFAPVLRMRAIDQRQGALDEAGTPLPSPRSPVRVWTGRRFESQGAVSAIGHDDPTWSALLAAASDLPDGDLASHGTLADLATATADFRDQYYGLVGHVVDQAHDHAGTHPRLATSGLVDPALLAWGRRPARFAKQAYTHPRVDLAGLDAPMQAWAKDRLVPKVLVATQSRVLEAVVDADGTVLPSVPVISVVPQDPADLWRIAALLCSPPATLVAARRHLGAARSSDALKLRAAEVLDLPLPADDVAWEAAADALRSASEAADAGDDHGHRDHLVASATSMVRAFGLPPHHRVLAWWTDRLPHALALSK